MSAVDPTLEGLQPWPVELVKHYCQSGVWGNQNLADWMERRLLERGNKIVLSGPGFPVRQWETLSGHALLDKVRRMARGIQALGLVRGDRVVVQIGNSNALVITLFALFELGVIPVMALPGHRHREIEHFLNLTNARAWFTSDGEGEIDFRQLGTVLRDSVPSLENVIIDCEEAGPHRTLISLLKPIHTSERDRPREKLLGHLADPAGIALLLCSGGTTGLPKLIPRTHRDYLYNLRASANVCELGPLDTYLVSLPAAHNFPLACPGILGAIEAGAGVVVCPAPSPEIAFEYIERSGATVTALVPPLVRVWLEYAKQNAPPPDSLRLLQVGGARLDAGLARRVPSELGCALQQVFGMAEGLLNFTRSSDAAAVINNTQGRPLSEFDEVRVVDSDGVDVPAGKRGELWTRGPYTLRGYYRDETANQRSFTKDGYYRSGDLVRQLSSGHLIVEGRTHEVIRRGAENVPVETLESLLVDHHAVSDAAVVGLPCERLGEQVCAVLVLTDEAGSRPTLRMVRQFLADEGIARLMLPDSIEIVECIPLTAVGKIARRQLVAKISKTEQPETEGVLTT